MSPAAGRESLDPVHVTCEYTRSGYARGSFTACRPERSVLDHPNLYDVRSGRQGCRSRAEQVGRISRVRRLADLSRLSTRRQRPAWASKVPAGSVPLLSRGLATPAAPRRPRRRHRRPDARTRVGGTLVNGSPSCSTLIPGQGGSQESTVSARPVAQSLTMPAWAISAWTSGRIRRVNARCWTNCGPDPRPRWRTPPRKAAAHS